MDRATLIAFMLKHYNELGPRITAERTGWSMDGIRDVSISLGLRTKSGRKRKVDESAQCVEVTGSQMAYLKMSITDALTAPPIAPAVIMDAEGNPIAQMDPLTRKRTRIQ